MKIAILLLAVMISSCSRKEADPGYLRVPVWACSQNPTGESRKDVRQEYCGRSCTRPVEYKQYATKVACEYTQWRDE